MGYDEGYDLGIRHAKPNAEFLWELSTEQLKECRTRLRLRIGSIAQELCRRYEQEREARNERR